MGALLDALTGAAELAKKGRFHSKSYNPSLPSLGSNVRIWG
jgi:hypothetical protein